MLRVLSGGGLFFIALFCHAFASTNAPVSLPVFRPSSDNIPLPLLRPSLPVPVFLEEKRPFAKSLLKDFQGKSVWRVMRSLHQSHFSRAWRLAHHEDLKNTILWLWATEEKASVSFPLLSALMKDKPSIAGYKSLKESLERGSMQSLSAEEIKAWFDLYPPVTGKGLHLYSKALLELGEEELARILIQRLSWEGMLNDPDFSYLLTPSDYSHWARGIAAREGRSATLHFMSLQENIDFTYDKVDILGHQAFVLLSRNRKTQALEIFQTPFPRPVHNSAHWWSLQRSLVAYFLRKKEFHHAYSVVASSNHLEGKFYSDISFLAGWLQMRMQNPQTAFWHFQKLQHHSYSLEQKAKSAYWLARALDAIPPPNEEDANVLETMLPTNEEDSNVSETILPTNEEDSNVSETILPPKNKEEARYWYEYAVTFLQTYYGQKAYQMIEDTTVASLTYQLPTVSPSPNPQGYSEKLLKTLDFLGENYGLYRLAMDMAQDIETQQQATNFLHTLTSMGDKTLVVKVSEILEEKGYHTFPLGYPLISLPLSETLSLKDKALIHAIVRQESRFQRNAISSAGAVGVMQLLPKTAQYVAKNHNMPYQYHRLQTDVAYNITLGFLYLKDLIEYFQGHASLALCAYNAGILHVQKWIEHYGDPRKGEISWIEWLESIPFLETRLYVQRVLASEYIYRRLLENP